MLVLRPVAVVEEMLEGGVRAVPPEGRRVGSGLPDEPGLVPAGVRMERIALAPKLMRRTKGVVGAVREENSSSSIAFSSIESEPFVEMLPRRMLPTPMAPVAEAGPGPPERPRVVTERRRRGSRAAAIGELPWLPGGPAEVELVR